MTRTTTRALTLGLATVAAVAAVAAPSPASAADMSFSKSSGRTLSTTWLEVGELPAGSGVPGNAHFGFLQVEETGNGAARAFGFVTDVQCEQGVTPYNPGGHHGGPAEGPCVVASERFLFGEGLSLTMDRKFSKAVLTGVLEAGSHGGPTSTPAVSVTLTGVGDTYSSTESFRAEDEYGTYSYRYSFTGRDAVVAAGSKIGPMVFDDEAGETSDAQMGSYRSLSRSRG